MGNYKTALAQYLELVDRDMKSKEQKNMIIYCYNIAICLENLHEYEESIKYLREVLVAITLTSGERHQSTGVILVDLGRLYSRAGKHQLGLENCKNAEEILTTSLGPVHPEVLIAKSTIADIYYRIKEYKKAIEIIEFLLSIQEAKGPQFVKAVAVLYHKLGNNYQGLGENEKAITQMKKAIELYSEKKIDLAVMYADLASIYEISGDKEAALENFFKSLEITEQFASENPTAKIDALNKIARTYSRLGDNINAIAYIQSALKYAEEQYEGPHFYIGLENNMLAILYERLGDLDASLKYFDKAIEIDLKSGGFGPNTAEIISSQGRIMALKGDIEQGLKNCELALGEIKKHGASETSEGAKVLFNLGRCQALKGKKEDAVKNMTKAYDIIKGIFGFNELWLGYIGKDLAELLYETGSQNQAIQILSEVFRVYKTFLGPNHNSVKESIVLAKNWGCEHINTFPH